MPRISSETAVSLGKPLVFLLCLAPLGLLAGRVLGNDLGASPAETVVRFTGIWALRLLLVTLAVTPLRRLTGLVWLVRFRRMLGLFAFAYAVLHFAAYLVLDRALVWHEIVRDIAERSYITVGFAALVLLVPLAVTSNRGWVRRLGRRWKRLHRTVYLIGALAVLHFLWLVKADLAEPLLYVGILAGLLAFRLPWERIAEQPGSGATAARGRSVSDTERAPRRVRPPVLRR